ncbi:MAG: hypothetical protein AAGG51_09810 [Cyanobacteria bacterium P01_G01_bin.54]
MIIACHLLAIAVGRFAIGNPDQGSALLGISQPVAALTHLAYRNCRKPRVWIIFRSWAES